MLTCGINLLTYRDSEVNRKCTMTSADFYESWVSHEEETEAVSCYYCISGKKVALDAAILTLVLQVCNCFRVIL